MKFKLIQFATLLIFVMSVVYLGHVQNSFGHDVSSHPPEFYVDDDGTNQGANKNGPNGEIYKDPRTNPTYHDSDGNGTHTASSWKMVYEASGLINGGHKENHPEHKNKASEMVFGVRVDLSASAGNSSCSGSASPSLTDDMGLSENNLPGWSGNAKIVISIPEKKDVHRPRGISVNGRYIRWWCQKIVVKKAGLDTKYRNIGIKIQKTTVTDKKSGEISGELGFGPASISATWSSGLDVAREGLHAYSFGITATVTPKAHWSIHSQLDKTTHVEGDLGEEIRPDPIYASFKGRTCSLHGS